VTLIAAPPNADPALHAWFERQHSVAGAWCCDVADGHVLTAEQWRASANGYQVLLEGAWLDVPANALRDPAGGPNPTGQAVVWYVEMPDLFHIYCFAPGTEL
jgi:hypothetical protein